MQDRNGKMNDLGWGGGRGEGKGKYAWYELENDLWNAQSTNKKKIELLVSNISGLNTLYIHPGNHATCFMAGMQMVNDKQLHTATF